MMTTAEQPPPEGPGQPPQAASVDEPDEIAQGPAGDSDATDDRPPES